MSLSGSGSYLKNNSGAGVFRIGIDIGSTTAKIVVLDKTGETRHWDYQRHKSDVLSTLLHMMNTLKMKLGEVSVRPAFTGSAGMGLSERAGLPFIQEMVAASEVVRVRHQEVKVLFDIGGEDSKMIFYGDRARPDMRMNDNCAGGTGAFIDQMASFLAVSLSEFDRLAQKGSPDHPIASRCGVFAKTDIQNLINTGVSKEDIACSVFRAVALQIINTLARGSDILSPVLFIGGPLYYFRSLRDSFREVLSLTEEETILPENPHLYPAQGAALLAPARSGPVKSLGELIRILKEKSEAGNLTAEHERLFCSGTQLSDWKKAKKRYSIPRSSLRSAHERDIFLGLDAGSTTTKLVVVDEDEQILFLYYKVNQGDPLGSVREGLKKLRRSLDAEGIEARLGRSVVTGYGEDLVKAAFEVDEGVVETLAHYVAAKKFEPRVSFLLDIGGQDMKAIYIQEGLLHNIEVNEACSSGCGSFIETFADSLGLSVAEFGELACGSEHPVDLGNRCTVFMNSSVKQALRQGSGVADISAGLAYSVIQNCLYKVLNISDNSELGERVVVQGGTFKNPAVLRALENLLGREVVRPDLAEYMGAYGAAIMARRRAAGNGHRDWAEHPVFRNLDLAGREIKRNLTCEGCTNHCQVRMLRFPNGRSYYTGNRCDRMFSNSDNSIRPGENLYPQKRDLLLNRPQEEVRNPALTIGLPMVLNNYENYPFWAAFFTRIGFRVVRSSIKPGDYLAASARTIMSDNICYPAKLAHAHILDLVNRKVDRIFFPRVVFEESKFSDSSNCYNCPVVTGYPDVIKSSLDPEKYGISMDSPPLNFNDGDLLRKVCREYVAQFNVPDSLFREAFAEALKARADYGRALREAGSKLIAQARSRDESMIVLAGRPYHADPMINHAIPEMIARMGLHVIPEDALPLNQMDLPERLEVVDQWEYSNRLYRAAHWAGREPGAELVQLNSFGCGPDAIVMDEVRTILRTYDKVPVVLKIDDISSLGSARLRVRSLIESRRENRRNRSFSSRPRRAIFKKEDRGRTILVPYFSPFYSLFAQSAFIPMGYKVETLPPPDRESVKLGLKYANNDICYPATIIIGDIIKALKSGRYDTDRIAVALTETGGQCRATNYVSLLKKALLNAGCHQIPVISVSLGTPSNNDQPGFALNTPKVYSLILSGLVVVDQLIRMYHATAVREVTRGESLAVLNKHIGLAQESVGQWTVRKSWTLMADAIQEFNRIRTYPGEYPRAGIVGEIYVKYNPFANGNIVDRFINEGVEVNVPPLITFFVQSLANVPFNQENHIKSYNRLARSSVSLLEKIIDRKIRKANDLMTQFKLPLMPIHTAQELAEKAKETINLCNQAGEGWLLPAEVVAMAEDGIRNIVSLQPFGCIANHIVAKGISKKLTELYPDLNFLPLNMDAGNSDANLQNRLAFFIHSAQESVKERFPVERLEKADPAGSALGVVLVSAPNRFRRSDR